MTLPDAAPPTLTVAAPPTLTVAAPPTLTVAAIYGSKTFDEKTLRQPKWLKSGALSYLDRRDDTDHTTVWLYEPSTGERRPLFDPDVLRLDGWEKPLTVHAVQWSPDETQLLLTREAPARFSACGDLFIYELQCGLFRALTATSEPQRHPKFSPDGAWVGVVRGDDLWRVHVETGREERLTHDASETVYNGRFGWVYEEELDLTDGWHWSPDGAQILFFQQDEAGVPEVLLPRYDDLHTSPRRTRYPKAGDPNPRTRVGVLTVETQTVRWLAVPGANSPDDYVARAQWTPDGSRVLVQRIPRLQNRIELWAFDVAAGDGTCLLAEEDEAWVDIRGDLRFVGTDRFLWPSDRDGFQRYYLYDLGGQCLGVVTHAGHDAEAIAHVDEERGTVVYVAVAPLPTERRLYRVGLDGGSPVELLDTPGRHTALFSCAGDRFVHTHSTADTPPFIALRDGNGELVDTLIHDAIPALADVNLVHGEGGGGAPGWEFLTFTTVDGETLQGQLLRPCPCEPGRRYPAIMYTYGGPGSQVVLNQWMGKRGLWSHLLARMGFAVFMVDNRGTGGRGRAFKKQVYRRLGEWETHDQIEGARFLGGLPFVDPERIGIWGWSYGGYMASLCLLRGADVFRAAVSVAPVTDWSLYDTIYTERYMRTPAENPDGYRNGSPVNHAASQQGRLLLIHGTMDDNVHFQNAARLATALQDAGKPFETMFYPGKHHGIEDRHQHLFEMVTAFWQRSL